MTQTDRDRLLVLKKAQKGLITQRQTAAELDMTERHIRRLLGELKAHGDQVVVHGLRGRRSNRKLSEEIREKIVQIISKEYPDFGPTFASEYLAKKHKLRIGREALRQDRGEKLYLIAMIDDATSELLAQFAPHDSTAENMRLLWSYLEKNGRPVAFYTDKASLFRTAPKIARDLKQLPRDEREPLPPTQIGRALRELGIVWLAAHSPQAKGRIERSFGTAQDRLVKGLRIAGANTLAEANWYLEQEFLPWWNQHLVSAPANATDAHRPLGPEHVLAAALSRVEMRQVANDYTIRFDGEMYRIARADICAGLRGATVRIECRLDGSLWVRFRERYLAVSVCPKQPLAQPQPAPRRAEQKPERRSARPAVSEYWRETQKHLLSAKDMPMWAASLDRTRTRDKLD